MKFLMFDTQLMSLDETFSLFDGFPKAPFVKNVLFIASDFDSGSVVSSF